MKHQDESHQERANKVIENLISYIKYYSNLDAWKRNEKESSVKLNCQFVGNIHKGNKGTRQYGEWGTLKGLINHKDEV